MQKDSANISIWGNSPELDQERKREMKADSLTYRDKMAELMKKHTLNMTDLKKQFCDLSSNFDESQTQSF
jgi:hypothetical protein